MKFTLKRTKSFDKDMKRCIKRGLPMSEMKTVMQFLQNTGTVPAKYKPHKLKGNYQNCQECHVLADWLLIWKEEADALVLILTNTGTHADLF